MVRKVRNCPFALTVNKYRVTTDWCTCELIMIRYNYKYVTIRIVYSLKYILILECNVLLDTCDFLSNYNLFTRTHTHTHTLLEKRNTGKFIYGISRVYDIF